MREASVGMFGAGLLLGFSLLAQVVVGSGAATDEAVLRLQGCEDDPGVICDLVLDLTGSQTAADVALLVIGKPLRIVLVLVLAWLLTWLLRRGGRRVSVWFVAAATRKREAIGEVPTAGERARIAERAGTVRRVLQSLVIALVWVVAALVCLAELGINLFPIIAAAGIAGIAVGFGAQTLVKDYLTGLLMLVENQITIGEDVDLGDASGVVTEMSLRTTTVRDDDGNLWHVANGEIGRVCNKSQAWSRALLDLRLPYTVDLDLARRTIEAVTHTLARSSEWSAALLDEPADPVIQELGTDAVVVRVSLRVRRGDKRPIERELRERVKRALDDAGIDLQLPQLIVHLHPGAA